MPQVKGEPASTFEQFVQKILAVPKDAIKEAEAKRIRRAHRKPKVKP